MATKIAAELRVSGRTGRSAASSNACSASMVSVSLAVITMRCSQICSTCLCRSVT